MIQPQPGAHVGGIHSGRGDRTGKQRNEGK